MNRRHFCTISGVAAAGAMSGCAEHTEKWHYITLSFDDGLKKSFIRTAEIFEKHGLRACLNVIAGAHLPDFVPPDPYIGGCELGDFTLWNELQQRGHEIMPHGYHHYNLSQMPFDEATGWIQKSLDLFTAELEGFDPRRAVFNFPFNASTPELEQWLDGRVLGYTAAGDNIMPLPHAGLKRLGRRGHGPDSAEPYLDRQIEDLLSRPEGWLVFNTHGLDSEGWGPIGSDYLDRLLARLQDIPSVRIIPAAQALQEVTPI